MKVSVVLSNWKRPENIPAVHKAWRMQSHAPEKIILVDNATVAYEGVDDFDQVIRIQENVGPPARYLGAVFETNELVVFADDDFLPGVNGLESALSDAEQLNWKFATLGYRGRKAVRRKHGRWHLLRRNTPMSCDKPTACDVTVRIHVVQTSAIQFAIGWWHRMRESGADERELRHDDIMLCLGIQARTSFASFCCRVHEDPEHRLIKRNLSAPWAVSGMAGHQESRDELVRRSTEAGWLPMKLTESAT